ncbi:MAG: N-acetylneuraminate synthase family protein, partial [Gemmatimonadaceae bacterium]
MEIALQSDANASGYWTRARENALRPDVVVRECVLNQSKHYAHTSRRRTQVHIGEASDAVIGGDTIAVIASGCRVALTDSPSVLHSIALTVLEVEDAAQVQGATRHANVLRVGAHNMQNRPLLAELARTQQPVILTRGHSATISEWLCAADGVARGGNDNVILCESGIRTYETATQFTLDVSAISFVKAEFNYPVIADVSNAAGNSTLVPALARAAIAAGADGITVSV